jgi:hypothetical protein
MMKKRLISYAIYTFSPFLSLLPLGVQADFIIEFTDGSRVTVGRYVEEGQAIKVYTPQGAIGFRRDEVKHITEVGKNEGTSTPLDAVVARPSTPAQASSPASSGEAESSRNIGKTSGSNKEQGNNGSKGSEAEGERLNEQYHDVAQQMDKTWEKHIRDVNAGASDEVLAENRRRLDELNLDRHKLIKAARQTDPDNVPAWAQ